jgi:hypothetical protein
MTGSTSISWRCRNRCGGRASARSCCVGIWVDTYGFQARGFYEKLGYELFGTIDDHPRGSHRFFFRKRL